MVKAIPPLLAFLMCEKALVEEDKVTSLIRIVDVLTLKIEVPEGKEEELRDLAVEAKCTVFTRWGLGEGEFVEELRVVFPDGMESPSATRVSFKKPAGFKFQQIRHGVSLAVRDPGMYKFRLYLDGQLVAELPFMVYIEKTAVRGRA